MTLLLHRRIGLCTMQIAERLHLDSGIVVDAVESTSPALLRCAVAKIIILEQTQHVHATCPEANEACVKHTTSI